MTTPYYQRGGVTLYHGDCLDVLPTLGAGMASSVVTDPPYELGFMGKAWDRSGIAFDPETWRKCLDAMKPGAFLLAFGGSRTSHRIAVAIEDAGAELRDTIMYLYGSGFPKSHQHLKPAFEPIVVARKPPEGSIAANVRRHGCGGLNIDGCRIPSGPDHAAKCASVVGLDSNRNGHAYGEWSGERTDSYSPAGRWPANVCHDGSDEVLEAFTVFGEKKAGVAVNRNRKPGTMSSWYGKMASPTGDDCGYGDSGSAARFFYTAKASKADRGEGNGHPTVKPTSLMEWLVKLVSPPDGVTLDLFAGSGTTGVACARLGVRFIGIEREESYCEIAAKRLDAEMSDRAEKLFA